VGEDSELRIYDAFVNVEGLRVRVPKPLLGFIPFTVSKYFGLYAVLVIAAPEASESALLLALAKSALADEFGPVSRSSPQQWRIQQIDRRDVGLAPATIREPGCIEQDWGALWYELGDETAKSERYEMAKTRLWEEGFKVSIAP